MRRSTSASTERDADVGEPLDVTDRTDPSALSTPLLSVREAARILGVTVSWVYEHLRPTSRDRLPFVKLGKYVRIHPADLAAYIDAKRCVHTSHRSR
ncbi:MAG: helix-turn-helix domain-containing protein [Vicinamibacterales bacterium]